ncbi:MAG: C40 family peptidase [Saprospiraceae bacterium]
MEYAACQVSIAPMRAQPLDKSEMVSQLLFGETVEVINHKNGWKQVVCSWDGYTGWVDQKQLKRLTPSEYDSYIDEQSVSLSLVEGLMAADHFVPLTLGAVLPHFDGLRCTLGDHSFQFSGPVATPGQVPATGEWISKIARRYLHAPYLWGGRSPFGIDSSGLTQMVYKIAGKRLLRDPQLQVTQGRAVDFMEQCQVGDLAFFDNEKGEINHVGIILPDCHLIHASGKVRIDKLDHFGIFSRDEKRYTHQLRIVKRILPDSPEERVDQMESTPFQSDEMDNQGTLFG